MKLKKNEKNHKCISCGEKHRKWFIEILEIGAENSYLCGSCFKKNNLGKT